ncbi:MAG: dienelactone hydrolase family protein [Bacillota bacterium]|jgi:predicted peptidase|nr:dienelactone hydrolase family protein [Bacillota bacterium]HHT91190.1 phospholipase [Bacillota bacterium]
MALLTQAIEATITQRFRLPYFLYLPPDYPGEASQKWPVVFFLHGAGERGADLSLLPRHGLMAQVQKGREFPFLLVAPQCPVDCTWDRILDQLDCLLEEIVREYDVDVERIYVTGLSMGGYGTWHWGARHPKAFAGLVPICGGTMPLLGFPEKIAVLKDVPVWVFHGVDDQVVPVARSEELVHVLTTLGAPVRFTKYGGVGHNAWDRAYAEPELIPWLLELRNTQFCLEKSDHCE